MVMRDIKSLYLKLQDEFLGNESFQEDGKIIINDDDIDFIKDDLGSDLYDSLISGYDTKFQDHIVEGYWGTEITNRIRDLIVKMIELLGITILA
jgi:hypothetical protein